MQYDLPSIPKSCKTWSFFPLFYGSFLFPSSQSSYIILILNPTKLDFIGENGTFETEFMKNSLSILFTAILSSLITIALFELFDNPETIIIRERIPATQLHSQPVSQSVFRSEERRVGKESR